MIQSLKQCLKAGGMATVDRISGILRCPAIPVPLQRAGSDNERTLDVPGYAQMDSFSCGAVAGAMVYRFFHPEGSFREFHDRTRPDREEGTGTSQLVRALRQSGLRVSERIGLTFHSLRRSIDAGHPVIVSIHNPGADHSHWVTVYGYGRNPARVFLATNGIPLLASNRVDWDVFRRIWSPMGNGLVCKPGSRRI